MEWNGMEGKGREGNGREWKGKEWKGKEWKGKEWKGKEGNGRDKPGYNLLRRLSTLRNPLRGLDWIINVYRKAYKSVSQIAYW